MCERRVSLAALVPTVAVVAALSAATARRRAARQSSAWVDAASPRPSLAAGIWGLGAYAQTRRDRRGRSARRSRNASS